MRRGLDDGRAVFEHTSLRHQTRGTWADSTGRGGIARDHVSKGPLANYDYVYRAAEGLASRFSGAAEP